MLYYIERFNDEGEKRDRMRTNDRQVKDGGLIEGRKNDGGMIEGRQNDGEMIEERQMMEG